MRLLLDTCALLWFVDDADRLSPRARQVLDDEAYFRFGVLGEHFLVVAVCVPVEESLPLAHVWIIGFVGLSSAAPRARR